MTSTFTIECIKFVAVVLTGAACYFFAKGNFFVKNTIGKCIALLIPCIYFPIFLLRPRNPRNLALMTPLATLTRWLYGLKVETRGTETLPKHRSGIVVVNHQCIFDSLMVIEIGNIMDKMVPLMKSELLPVFPFGPALWLCGSVFIKRNDPVAAYKSLQDATKEVIKDEGRKILFFPEGTRNYQLYKTRKLLPFKKGAFKIAIEAQLPVFPVVISPTYFFKKDRFTEGNVIVEFLPPIETKNMTPDDVDQLVDKTAALMQGTCDRLYQEVLSSLSKKHDRKK